MMIADIGCGTGILTRQLVDRNYSVIAIDPNIEMLELARQKSKSASNITAPFDVLRSSPVLKDTSKKIGKNPSSSNLLENDQSPISTRASNQGGAVYWLNQSAESTCLPSNSIDIVISAQAFHWFNPERALQEFSRILKANGLLILLWNSADESDPFTAQFWKILKDFAVEQEVVKDPHHFAGKYLLESSLFPNAQKIAFENWQKMDLDSLIGRAFSASFAPKDESLKQKMIEQFKEIYTRFQIKDQISLKYSTDVYFSRKIGSSVDSNKN